jgi:myo-inositol-1(or 4)-monophosphatase
LHYYYRIGSDDSGNDIPEKTKRNSDAGEKMVSIKPDIDLNEPLSVLSAIMKGTRTLIEQALKSGFAVKTKPDKSFVTDVDIQVEEYIRRKLQQAYPSHSILGEELSFENQRSDFLWVIDPIDGTNSFKNKIPLFGTMVCLCYHGNPVAGVIDLPGTDQFYSGALGLGTRCNGQKIELTDLPSIDLIEDEILSVGERIQFVKAGKARFFDRLMRSHGHVRTYCDCFGHSLAVSGSVGGMADFDLRLWDLLATKILIEEAGGKFIFLEPPNELHIDRKYNVIFGKPKVVDWFVQMIDETDGADEDA